MNRAEYECAACIEYNGGCQFGEVEMAEPRQSIRRQIPLAGVLALVLSVGCGKPPAPPVPPAVVALPTPPATVAESPAASSGPSESSAVASVQEPPAQPAAPPVSIERILLLTPAGPLIVEFQLAIDGRPHVEALEKLVTDVLKLADTDADGRATWKEITASKRFKYGQYGNLPVGGENDVKQVIERYDIDRDALVDASELPRFLTRNAGGSRAFSVRGTADYRHANRRSAPLWQAIDADDDGALSTDELAAAPGKLLGRDTDDDEILVAAELNPQEPLDPGMRMQRQRRGPDMVRLLGSHADWDAVRLALEEEFGSPLAADSFPLTPELFAGLDANKDGRLQKAELANFNTTAPHLVVAVDFATRDVGVADGEDREGETPAEPEPARPEVRLVRVAEPFAQAATTAISQPSRLALSIAGTTIILYVNDTLAGGNYEAQAMQALTLLDADKNGYLEAKEVPADAGAQFGQFEAVDADEDGKAFPAEIVAYLAQQQAAMRGQIHAKASDREDVLFAALDQNYDERLDAREIEDAPRRLVRFDRDGDGQVTSDELPASLSIGLARGNLENMDALFAPPPLAAQGPAADAPRWFTAMDTNQDGVVSPREFVGPAEKFGPLDANSDGLLDLAEAKATQPTE
jgi:Ca2+-binding EF-hand superfamily protein